MLSFAVWTLRNLLNTRSNCALLFFMASILDSHAASVLPRAGNFRSGSDAGFFSSREIGNQKHGLGIDRTLDATSQLLQFEVQPSGGGNGAVAGDPGNQIVGDFVGRQVAIRPVPVHDSMEGAEKVRHR